MEIVINVRMGADGKVQVQTNADSKILISGLMKTAEDILLKSLEEQSKGSILRPTLAFPS